MTIPNRLEDISKKAPKKLFTKKKRVVIMSKNKKFYFTRGEDYEKWNGKENIK